MGATRERVLMRVRLTLWEGGGEAVLKVTPFMEMAWCGLIRANGEAAARFRTLGDHMEELIGENRLLGESAGGATSYSADPEKPREETVRLALPGLDSGTLTEHLDAFGEVIGELAETAMFTLFGERVKGMTRVFRTDDATPQGALYRGTFVAAAAPSLVDDLESAIGLLVFILDQWEPEAALAMAREAIRQRTE